MSKNKVLNYIKIFSLLFLFFIGFQWFFKNVLNINFLGEKPTELSSSSKQLYKESNYPRPIKIQDNSPLFTLQNAYNVVAEKTIEAVVSIQVERENEINNYENYFRNDEFLKRFFGIPDNPRKRKSEAFGSGFLISPDGYLISNYHVVDRATKITIIFKNSDKEYIATVVGSDKDTDVALLKIKSKKKFPFLELANSEKVKIGDIVIAIGNPFALSHTFTTGVVSAKGRTGVVGNRYENFIQTDVAINPGNSGGPLLNLYGEVIGINSAIISRGGGSIGIGFSIPINMAKNILDQLKEDGKVSRGWLGIYYNEITKEIAQALEIPQKGVIISRIIKDSPISKGNVKEGDILIEFNSKQIKDGQDLIRQLGSFKIGKEVTLTLLRNGKKIKTKIIIAVKDEALLSNEDKGQAPSQERGNSKYFGIEVVNINKDFKRQKNLKNSGVLITRISSESPLKNKLAVGDIILSINKKATSNLENYEKQAENLKKESKVLLLVQRDQAVHYLVFILE